MANRTTLLTIALVAALVVLAPTLCATAAATDTDAALDYLKSQQNADGGYGSDPGYDRLQVTGTLTLTSLSATGFTIDIDSLNLSNNPGAPAGAWPGIGGTKDFQILDAVSIVDFNDSMFALDSSGFVSPTAGVAYTWTIESRAGDTELWLVALGAELPVPEPSTVMLLGLGATLLHRLVRKRARAA